MGRVQNNLRRERVIAETALWLKEVNSPQTVESIFTHLQTVPGLLDGLKTPQGYLYVVLGNEAGHAGQKRIHRVKTGIYSHEVLVNYQKKKPVIVQRYNVDFAETVDVILRYFRTFKKPAHITEMARWLEENTNVVSKSKAPCAYINAVVLRMINMAPPKLFRLSLGVYFTKKTYDGGDVKLKAAPKVFKKPGAKGFYSPQELRRYALYTLKMTEQEYNESFESRRVGIKPGGKPSPYQ